MGSLNEWGSLVGGMQGTGMEKCRVGGQDLPMIEDPPRPPSRHRYPTAAILLIVCGVGSIAIHLCRYAFAPPELFVADGRVKPWRASLTSVQPKAEEWPLQTAKQSDPGVSDFSGEHYQLNVVRLRNTEMLMLEVAGASPERTGSLAAWLTDAFEKDLRRSLVGRGIDNESELPLVINQTGYPPNRFSKYGLLSLVEAGFQMGTPVLLLGSALLLHRASRSGGGRA